MKTIYIRGGEEKESGAVVLLQHLKDKGHQVVRSENRDYDVIVCWGCSTRDPRVKNVPALNKHVNLYNKYEALVRFRENGINTPVVIPSQCVHLLNFHPKWGPWFGRRFHHERGKDIKIFKSWESISNNPDRDFFTLYFEHTDELRAWVFQNKVFAWYKKHYQNPSLDNYKNLEFRSEFLGDYPDLPGILERAAVDSVRALKLDFGAVDILYNCKINEYVILEVNSMPEISSQIRVSGIRLANIISDWTEVQ